MTVYVNLLGGMGNQLFQYAFGKKLALAHNVPLKLSPKTLKRKNPPKGFVNRDYDLDLFCIKAEIGTPKFPLLVKKITETQFKYTPEIVEAANETLSKGKSILIEGYWQSPAYFEAIEDTIREDFTFAQPLTSRAKELLQKIESENSVLINVRRTDFLTAAVHGVVGLEYVNDAIQLIETKISNPHYYIFSDDIEWCKENFKLENMTIVDHSYKGDRFSDYLQLMIACKHFIIPNSTFAWWAAWLNTSTEKMVIAPKDWFADKSHDTSLLIPKNWIRI